MTFLKETSTGRNRQEWVNYLAVLVATDRGKGQVKKEFRPDPIRSPGFVAIPFMIKVGGSGWAPESTVHGGVPIGHLRGSRVFGYLSFLAEPILLLGWLRLHTFTRRPSFSS